MLAIRLPREIEKRLYALSKKTGRPKSFYVREAILKHLDELEYDYLSEHLLDEIHSQPVKLTATPAAATWKEFRKAS